MKKPGKYQDEILLTDVMDTVFAVSEEKIANNGEDCYAYSVNDVAGLLAVCDGCGGLGALQYPDWKNKTGAFMASRAATYSIHKWFEKSCSNNQIFSGHDERFIKDSIQNGFKMFDNSLNYGSRIKGSMVRPFPTTLAASLFNYQNGKINVNAVWAGDSRVYYLTNQGLSQLSVDDIYGEDALSNLTKDGALTNVVSADGNYTIHSQIYYGLNLPNIIITSTDGCFGYLQSPMHFEYILLGSLVTSQSILEWKDKLSGMLREISGDDATMCLAAFGHKSFSEMKRNYTDRLRFIYDNYIQPLDEGSDERVYELWNEYKKGYYCMLSEEQRRLYL